MRCSILHTGIPIGHVTIRADAPTRQVVAFAPTAEYEALRQQVRRASVALHTTAIASARAGAERAGAAGSGEESSGRDHTARAVTNATLRADREVLGEAIALGRRLELRDAEGRMVPASYVELIEPLRPEDPIAAVIGLREALAGTQAVVRAPPTADGEAGALPA